MHPQKITVNEHCMWGETIQYNCYEEKIKATSIAVSIDKIVSGIMASVAIAAGDLSHITTLLKTDINLHISSSKYSSSVISKSVISTAEEKYYVMLKYEKKTAEKKTIIGNIFNYNNTDFYLHIEYAVLEPINELARDKCRERKSAFVENILDKF